MDGKRIIQVILRSLMKSYLMYQMTANWTWGIFILRKIATGTRLRVWHGLQTTLTFLPADGKIPWLVLPGLNAQCNRKISNLRCDKTKKGEVSTLLLAPTKFHFFWINLNRPYDSNSMRNTCSCTVKNHLPTKIFIVAPSLEGWPNKAKKVSSLHVFLPNFLVSLQNTITSYYTLLHTIASSALIFYVKGVAWHQYAQFLFDPDQCISNCLINKQDWRWESKENGD